MLVPLPPALQEPGGGVSSPLGAAGARPGGGPLARVQLRVRLGGTGGSGRFPGLQEVQGEKGDWVGDGGGEAGYQARRQDSRTQAKLLRLDFNLEEKNQCPHRSACQTTKEVSGELTYSLVTRVKVGFR